MNEGQQGAGSTGRTDPSKGLEPVHAEAFANFCSHLLGALNNGFRAHIWMFEPERGERPDTRAARPWPCPASLAAFCAAKVAGSEVERLKAEVAHLTEWSEYLRKTLSLRRHRTLALHEGNNTLRQHIRELIGTPEKVSIEV